MAEAEDILISVHPRHVDSMVRGRKTVELRRRPLKLANGCRVWIYCTLPRGSVEALGVVHAVVAGSPVAIWRDYGRLSGITKAEFDTYYEGADIAYAIVFSSIEKLDLTFALAEIRRHLGNFHPPQFFKRLSIGSPELNLFTEAISSPSSTWF
jgi:predicted transcriptional regulator